ERPRGRDELGLHLLVIFSREDLCIVVILVVVVIVTSCRTDGLNAVAVCGSVILCIVAICGSVDLLLVVVLAVWRTASLPPLMLGLSVALVDSPAGCLIAWLALYLLPLAFCSTVALVNSGRLPRPLTGLGGPQRVRAVSVEHVEPVEPRHGSLRGGQDKEHHPSLSVKSYGEGVGSLATSFIAIHPDLDALHLGRPY